jgi:hypothetical protein
MCERADRLIIGGPLSLATLYMAEEVGRRVVGTRTGARCRRVPGIAVQKSVQKKEGERLTFGK